MAKLKFIFFGPPSFSLDETPIRVGRRKAVALAAFMSITGKSHSRDRLAALFWPEHDRERARSSLRRTLSVMTKALGNFWLAIDRDSIGFVPHENLWVDVTRFRELTAISPSGPADVLSLEEAAWLLDSSFLSGFSLGDCPDFDDWQFEQAEGLHREGALVLERLSGWLAQRGEYPRAIRHALKWTEIDPLNETAHRQLIRLFRRTGQMGHALRQFEKCKILLQKELGVEPDELTSALAADIHTRPPVATNDFSLPLTNLPAQSTPFLGRKQELKTLVTRVSHPEVRLLTLIGPGGIGKTRLALEAARLLEAGTEMADRFPQGLYFLSLGDLSSMEALVTALFKIFGLSFDEQSDPLEQLIGFLNPRRVLLVLDNLEHLPEAGELVSKMLTQATGLKILATSRTRLMLQGEHLFSLSGLHYPDLPLVEPETSDLSEMEKQFDALGLFLYAARMLRPDMELNGTNIHGVAEICKLTQGMPLALILAAGWVEIFPPGKIADEIRKSLGFLKSDLHDLPPDHQSMRAVFDSSWVRLPESERDIFMKLSVFRDGFTMDAAAAVVDTDQDSIASMGASLVRKSMLKSNPETGRFEIHPLLRHFGREMLAQQGLTDGMMNAHGRFYLDRVRDHENRLIGKGMLACRQEMDDDFANIRQAWLRNVDQGNLEALARAAAGLYVYFDMHTRYHEGEAMFRPAKDLLMRVWRQGMDPDVGVILLCWFDMQAQGLCPQDQPCASAEAFGKITTVTRELLRLAVKHGHKKARAIALLLLGAMAQGRNLYSRAIRFFRLSLEQDPGMEHCFWGHIRIGLCWRALGEMHSAVGYFGKSHVIGNQHGDAVKRAWSLKNIGSTELCMGDLETAEKRLRAAETFFREINAPIGVVFSQEELGWIAFLKGDLTRAVMLADQASKISMALGLARSRYQSVQALKGLALVAAGEPDQGKVCLEKVLPTGVAGFTAHLGMVFICHLKGAHSAAEGHLESAAQKATTVYQPQLKVLWRLAAAAVGMQARDDRKSCELLGQVFHHPSCPSGLFKAWELPGTLVAGLKSRMTPDQFNSAWEQGKMLQFGLGGMK